MLPRFTDPRPAPTSTSVPGASNASNDANYTAFNGVRPVVLSGSDLATVGFYGHLGQVSAGAALGCRMTFVCMAFVLIVLAGLAWVRLSSLLVVLLPQIALVQTCIRIATIVASVWFSSR